MDKPSKPATYPMSADEKRSWLADGRIIEYPKQPPESVAAEEWDSMRTIPAEMLKNLFDKKTRSCSVPIRLRHVIVDGKFLISYAVCPFEVSVNEESTFTSEVNFSYATFSGVLHLGSSVFAKTFKMDFATCNYDLRIEAAVFHEDASFVCISVGGRLIGRGAQFKAKAAFSGLRCTKLASFRSSHVKDVGERITSFADEANFLDSKFENTIEFNGVQFSGKVDFGRSSVAGNAVFGAARMEDNRPELPARFKGPVHFVDAVISGSASFGGAEFDQETNFQRLRVGGGLYFPEAKFKEKATVSFDGIQVERRIVFRAARFDAPCTFETAQIKGGAYFPSGSESSLPTRFRAGANFRDVSIGGNANFNGVEFWAPSEQPEQPAADFTRIAIGGSAFFGATSKASQTIFQTTFVGKAIFDDISIQGICWCGGVSFSEQLQFRRARIGSNAYFGIVEIDKQPVKSHFGGPSNFFDCQFGGTLDCNGAHFEGPTSWDGSVVGGSVFFRPFRSDQARVPVTFKEDALFRDVQVSGIADFSGANFKKLADFVRSKFGGGLFFSAVRVKDHGLHTPRFCGGLRLFGCQIGGNLDMSGAEHEELADLESVQIRGNLLCRGASFREIDLKNPALLAVARFKKGARLPRASVDGAADFSESEFGAFADFRGIRVSGPVIFRTFLDNPKGNKVTFQDADFSGATFSGTADFEGVHFALAAAFIETRIAGSCRFNLVQWDNWANFNRCEVQGDAYFDRNVKFNNTTFEGSRFGRQCLFSGAQFTQGLNFSRSRVDGMLSLDGSQISGRLSLEDSTVGSAVLDMDVAKSALTEVNLKGFSYTRMNAPWKVLFRHTPDDPVGKSHLQSYSQLEKYFRAAGFERDADDVYLARRKREWKLLWKGLWVKRSKRAQSWPLTLFRLLEDCVLRFVFNYGVPSYRLLGAAVVLFVLGGLLLTLPGALEPRPGLVSQPQPLPTNQWERLEPALGAFFADVVPGERSKVFTDWEPSRLPMRPHRPSFAQGSVTLSLLIYFCVTISLASLAGLIKRKQW